VGYLAHPVLHWILCFYVLIHRVVASVSRGSSIAKQIPSGHYKRRQ
jgi:hypothetical protein